MLEPLDRFSRDSTLFQFTSRRLRDFIDPRHLLIQIDEEFDFQKLVELLEDYYCRDNGRPAIHPEVLVRALLISALYNITSFRRLCSAISENMVVAPASRSSVTSLSWKVPAARSTRPLACGDSA